MDATPLILQVGLENNMTILDEYLGDMPPQGFREQVAPLFTHEHTHSKPMLNAARELLERLLHHLSVLSGVQLREVSAIIQKLASLGTIDHEVRPYFQFWWDISCLGSHYQPTTTQVFSWDKHLELCRHAIGVCISWYLRKYPPLRLTAEERETWLSDASAIFPVAYDEIQVCCQPEIERHLTESSLVVLYGRSWVGKTSIGSRITSELAAQGYIPLVIHENSLVTFRALPHHDQPDSPNNLRLARNAQVLHEIVSTRLLHGDSFALFLDDPFGHRRFQGQNPLMYLRIQDWLSLASLPHSLGKVKVIIATPREFLIAGRSALQENAKTNPIARDNLVLLDDQNTLLLEVTSYDQDQLTSIVHNSSRFHGCAWSSRKECCELVAEILVRERLGFDALHVLCRDLKVASDDEFLERVSQITAAADIHAALDEISPEVQVQLCAAYVGEALIEFYREFAFQTHLTFDDICRAASDDPSGPPSTPCCEISEWLLADRVSTLSLSSFPVFTHPEVRCAVAIKAETTMEPTIREIVTRLSGLSGECTDKTLMRWEAVHLLCRMAAFLDETQAEKMNQDMFWRPLSGGGDPRNILWAVVGNWSHIRGTAVEGYALGFLKAIPNNFRWLIRAFTWEAAENWTHLGTPVRVLVLAQTGQGSELSDLRPRFDDQSTLSFLAAGVVHYGAIQECARGGCDASERYLDFMNIFISQLAKQEKPVLYTSRKGDGLFEAPGSRFSACDVLQHLWDLGLRCGSVHPNHPLAGQLKVASS